MRKEEGRRKRGGSKEGKRQEWQKGEREGEEGKRIEEEVKRGSEGGMKGKNGRKGVGGKESVRFDISMCLFLFSRPRTAGLSDQRLYEYIRHRYLGVDLGNLRLDKT